MWRTIRAEIRYMTEVARERLVDPNPRLYIGGEWTAGDTDGSFPSIDPSTGQIVARVPLGNTSTVDYAVTAARAAFPTWARTDIRERARVVQDLARDLRSHVEELATIDALDAGLPIRVARNDVRLGIERLEYYAGIAHELKGTVFPYRRRSFVYTVRQPHGVVAVITPFNHPVMFALSKIAAPLVCGNCVVLKPPEQASLSTLALASHLHQYVPPGVVNIVTGDGQTGASLVSSERVHMVSFTGSVDVGRRILSATARDIKPAVLELGGKGAAIVFPDAPLGTTVSGIVAGMSLGVCGQSCQSSTRLYLHERVHDAFVAELLGRVESVRIGDPLEDDTAMGPLISHEQLERVTGYIEKAREEGAQLLTGGSRPPVEGRLAGGNFIQPTVFDGVSSAMAVGREEIFGPVLSIFSWNDYDAMMHSVNSSPYGLTASVWTTSQAAQRVAEDIEAGYVYINQHGGSVTGAPFGGWRRSGLGTEHSIEELHEYSRLKTVDQILPEAPPLP